MTDLTFIEQNVGKNKTKIDVLRKLTHLHLNDRYISQIGFVGVWENLQVLYLHNNDISKINNNLAPLKTLKHLYLQKNKITKLEGLDSLTQLRKLYIGCNEISVIEGLDRLQNLEELHAEKQRLSKGECLCFNPRTIYKLSNTLQILNISHNNLTSLNCLKGLKFLKFLNASYNDLSNIEEVVKVIQNLFHLHEINFIGNPISKQYRYKDNIFANTFRLISLDNKNINDTTSSFIKRFEGFEYEKSQHRLNSAFKMTAPKIILSLQKAIKHKQSITKTMSTTVLTTTTTLNDEHAQEGDDDDDIDKYVPCVPCVPWKALKVKATISESGKMCPPLFMKLQLQKQKKPTATFSMFPDLPKP